MDLIQGEFEKKRFRREDYKDCLAYIENYWTVNVMLQKDDDPKSSAIGLPHPFMPPNKDRFPYQFYWGTCFVMQGLNGTKYEGVAKGMVEN